MKKYIFLDRDGVINIDTGYVYKWQFFEYCEGSIAALKKLIINDYNIIIVTNQSGIARGYFTEADYQLLSQKIRNDLNQYGIDILEIFHCPHHPSGKIKAYTTACLCRKPNPGLILKAAYKYNIQLQQSIMIGDKLTDIEAAKKSGIGTSYLIDKNNVGTPKCDKFHPRHTFSSLLECIDYIL